jgi:hypothetical protein
MKKLFLGFCTFLISVSLFAQSKYDNVKHSIHSFILIPAMILEAPAANRVQSIGKTVPTIH